MKTSSFAGGEKGGCVFVGTNTANVKDGRARKNVLERKQDD